MPHGTVRRATEPPLSGTIDGTAWERAAPLSIDQFPWAETERRQPTTVRLLYDDQSLFVQFIAEDDHCSASVTELNGPVYEDSCVEMFVAPRSAEPREYVNFEANCVGTFLLGVGTPGDRRRIDPKHAEQIRVETSVPGPTADGPPSGNEWWLTAALPFETLSAVVGVEIQPEPGTEWRANFYRCGGAVDPQFAAWAPIDAPEPDFHRPADFGTIAFE